MGIWTRRTSGGGFGLAGGEQASVGYLRPRDPRQNSFLQEAFLSSLASAWIQDPAPGEAKLRQTLGEAHFAQLRSLSQESDPEIFFESLLAFGWKLEVEGKTDQATELYAAIVGEDAAQVSIRQRAQQRLDALAGRGHAGLRAEVLLKDFAKSASDYRTILPMLGGSLLYQTAKAASLGRLAATPRATWLTRGAGAQLRSVLLGTSLEVPAFTLLQRGLMDLSGEEISWDRASVWQDLARSAVTLGALKLSAGFGKQFSGGNQLFTTTTSFLGLLGGHHLQVALRLQPHSDNATILTDALANFIALGIGAHLGQGILGKGVNNWQRELALRSQGNSPPKPSIPIPTQGDQSPLETAKALAIPGTTTAPWFFSIRPSVTSEPPLSSAAKAMGGNKKPGLPDLAYGGSSVLERAIQKTKDEMYFRYGRVAADHPVQLYLDRLGARLPVKEGMSAKFILLPEWNAANAISLPDGAVFIAHGLLKKIGSEEALLGVMAHEYVHGYRQHVNKTFSIGDKEFATRAIKQIGLERMHEYEADLRGALDILEEIRVTPLPFKEFLMDLWRQKTEELRLGIHHNLDRIHGSGLDRALNIGSLTYSLDLKGLENAAPQPIPQGMLRPPAELGDVVSYRAVIRNPDVVIRRGESGDALREERLFKVESLNLAELTQALRVLWERREKRESRPDSFYDWRRVWQKALNRFSQLAVGGNIASYQDRIRVLAYLWFFAGLEPQFLPTQELITNRKDLETLRLALEKSLQTSIWSYSTGSTQSFWNRLIDFSLEKQIFHAPENGKLDRKAFRRFLKKWPLTLSRLSQRFDLNEPLVPEQYLKSLLSTLKESDDLQKALMQEDVLRSLGTKPRAYRHALQISNLAKALSQLPPRRLLLDYAQIGTQLIDILGPTAELKDLTKALQLIVTVMSEAHPLRFFQGFEEKKGAMTWGEISELTFLVPFLFHYALDHLPALRSIPEWEKRLLSQSVARRWIESTYKDRLEDFNRFGQFWPKSSKQGRDFVDVATERINQEIELAFEEEMHDALRKLTFKIDELLDETKLYSGLGEAGKVPLAYRFLHDESEYERNLGIGYNKFPDELSALAASLAIHDLDRRALAEIPGFLDAWKSQGTDVEALIASRPKLAGRLVLKLVKALGAEIALPLKLGDWIRFGDWIANPFLRSLYLREVKNLHWEELDFEEKLKLLFPLPGSRGIQDNRSREEFIEHEMKTQEDFRKVVDRLKSSLDSLSGEARVETGLAVLADLPWPHREIVGFLQALLSTRNNDRNFKETIYDFLRGVEFTDKKNERMEGKPAVSRRVQLADDIARLLLTLDGFAKQVLLRKLLVGEGGALHEKNRSRFLEMLFRDWVTREKSQADLSQVLSDVRSSLARIEEWELLYFALQSVLVDQIALPPDREATVAWDDLFLVEHDLEGAWGLKRLKAAKKEIRGDQWENQVPDFALEKPWEHSRGFANFAESSLRDMLEKMNSGSAGEEKVMTPLRFIKELASRLGSLGVRFLQLLPLIVELKPEYGEEFAEVYDRVKGQSKLAAIYLLEREWPTFWEEIRELGERIGGGSVATVYRAHTHDGQTEAIKVRNPNIHHHLEQTYRFAKAVLDDLIRRNPQVPAYRNARLLLNDILTWVKADVSFTDFLEKDREFRKWVQANAPVSGNYRIYIPQSKEPASPYFAREEYVEATNLTRWSQLEKQGHDMKAVTRLAVKFYFAQIANGRVLSDTHAGNMAVTRDGRLVIYDRNFYLDLHPEERNKLVLFLNPAFPEEARAGALFSLLTIPREASPSLIEVHVLALVSNLKSQNWKAAQRSLIKIRECGAELPLVLTLLLKNFQSLHQLAAKAGFRNLLEAHAYQPKGKAHPSRAKNSIDPRQVHGISRFLEAVKSIERGEQASPVALYGIGKADVLAYLEQKNERPSASSARPLLEKLFSFGNHRVSEWAAQVLLQSEGGILYLQWSLFADPNRLVTLANAARGMPQDSHALLEEFPLSGSFDGNPQTNLYSSLVPNLHLPIWKVKAVRGDELILIQSTASPWEEHVFHKAGARFSRQWIGEEVYLVPKVSGGYDGKLAANGRWTVTENRFFK